MVWSLQPLSFPETLAHLERVHIDLLLKTIDEYKQRKLKYPTINIDDLVPPFGKLSSEHPHFPCHINVLVWDTYKVRKHDRHFPIKQRLSLETARGMGGKNASRFVGATGFPTLYAQLASGAEDGATIMSLDTKHKHPKVTHHLAHINVDAANALKRLTRHLAGHGIKRRLRDSEKEYHQFRAALADKLYERVGWPNTGGQKHLAAACLLLNMDPTSIAIDILSTSGAYTRILRDEKSNPVVRHVIVQPKELVENALMAIGADVEIPHDCVIDKRYVLLALTYARTGAHTLEEPWMALVDEALLHPRDPTISYPLAILRHAAKEAQSFYTD